MQRNISPFWLYPERRDTIISKWRGMYSAENRRGQWATAKTAASKANAELVKNK